MLPLIDDVVVLNEADNIVHTLQSICKGKNIEIIIVDGGKKFLRKVISDILIGSTDSTVSLIENFKTSVNININLLHSEKGRSKQQVIITYNF